MFQNEYRKHFRTCSAALGALPAWAESVKQAEKYKEELLAKERSRRVVRHCLPSRFHCLSI
eukprot:SAG22_NODE_5062_length_1097_cov_1.114228_2_plen_61_part_00